MTNYDPHYVNTPAYFLLGVKVIVVNKSNQMLLLKRSDKVSSPHRWDFPGGGVDKGESPEASAVRECLEEAGLAIENIRPLTTFWQQEGSDEVIIIGFSATVAHDEITLSWEHEDYRWIAQDSPVLAELPEMHVRIHEAYKKQLISNPR